MVNKSLLMREFEDSGGRLGCVIVITVESAMVRSRLALDLLTWCHVEVHPAIYRETVDLK